MKLWLIMRLFGEIAGYAGPLPYGLAECEARAQEMRDDFAGKTTEVSPGHVVRGEDFTFECVFQQETPKIVGAIADETKRDQ